MRYSWKQKSTKRWDGEREYFVDPQGNPTVDPQKEKFEVLKKKTLEEIVDESRKMVDELKSSAEKVGDEKLESSAKEVVAEKEQVIK
ncbi:hypothetical protein Hanom_Chr04g00333781 [Helianthus anomalus]